VTARQIIPFALVWLRMALGPFFLGGYALSASPWFYVTMLLVAVVSDVLDGTLARRWKTVTPQLRRWDSNADSVCFGLATVTVALLRGAYLAPWRWAVAAMLLFIFAQNLFNLIRYRRQPAYHMWSGKLWSIVFMITLIGLFFNGPSVIAIDTLIALSIYSSTENIIATAILPEPMTDVPTVFHAIGLARG
jgi:CDP-diacylglycerol--glycerol-3-phosphate 3-phosphatidyltransferase